MSFYPNHKVNWEQLAPSLQVIINKDKSSNLDDMDPSIRNFIIQGDTTIKRYADSVERELKSMIDTGIANIKSTVKQNLSTSSTATNLSNNKKAELMALIDNAKQNANNKLREAFRKDSLARVMLYGQNGETLYLNPTKDKYITDSIWHNIPADQDLIPYNKRIRFEYSNPSRYKAIQSAYDVVTTNKIFSKPNDFETQTTLIVSYYNSAPNNFSSGEVDQRFYYNYLTSRLIWFEESVGHSALFAEDNKSGTVVRSKQDEFNVTDTSIENFYTNDSPPTLVSCVGFKKNPLE